MQPINVTLRDIAGLRNLYLAAHNASKHRTRAPSVRSFYKNEHVNVREMHEQLLNGTYRRGGYHEFWIRDPKLRMIAVLEWIDRVVHWAIYMQCKDDFNKRFLPCSYGVTAKRGVAAMIPLLSKWFHESDKFHEKAYFLKMDISKFFYRIDPNILMYLLCRMFRDAQLLDLLEQYIERDPHIPFGFDLETKQRIFEKGIACGMLFAGIFAEIYMHEFDKFVKHDLHVSKYMRYCDDMVIVHHNKRELREIQYRCEDFLFEKLQLELNRKTKIDNIKHGITYCGFRIFPDYVKVRRTSYQKMIGKLLYVKKALAMGVVTEAYAMNVASSYYGFLKIGDTKKLRIKLFGTDKKPRFKKFPFEFQHKAPPLPIYEDIPFWDVIHAGHKE